MESWRFHYTEETDSNNVDLSSIGAVDESVFFDWTGSSLEGLG